MPVLDMTEPVSRVRLSIADYNDPVILTDEVIQYTLDKNSGNEQAAIKECAYFILGALSKSTRQRLDRIELWGSDAYNQYLSYIKEVIRSPNGAYASAGIYAAGVDVQDIIDNAVDTTVFQKPLPVGNGNSEYDSIVSTELKYE